MAFGNIFRVVCNISMPNAVGATLNKYIAATTNGTDPDFTTLLGQCATWLDGLSALVDTQTVTAVTYDSVSLYKVDDVTGQEVLFDVAALTPTPANTSSMIPSTNAAMLGAPVQDGRGILKWHLPGFGQNTLQSDGLFSPTTMVALGLAAIQMQTGLQLTSPLSAAPISWNPVTKTSKAIGSSSYSINIPSHQDRRQVGVGS